MSGLARVINNAARLGDAHGDHAFALKLLDNGLAKFRDPPFLSARGRCSIGPNWPLEAATDRQPESPWQKRCRST
jgi:hypothetical protein